MEIKFNDDKELATHIEPINKDLEYLKGATALSHIRTPLFFEHQKDAFSEILSSMASIKKEWINNASDDGLYESFSIKSFTEFESLLIKYQLFLDDDCLFVLSFILHEYDSSITNSPAARKKQLQYTLETEGMNIDEAKYESYFRPRLNPADPDEEQNFIQEYCHYKHYVKIDFLSYRLASLFRKKIGIESNSNELYKIAILIAVEHITNYKKVIEHKDDKSLNEICHIGKHDFLNEEKFIIGNKKENILIEALKLHRELLKEKEDIYVLSKKLDKLLSIIESAK